MSNLIEHNTSLFIRNELIKSNATSNLYNTLVLNTILIATFIIIISLTLYIRYKNKIELQPDYEEKKTADLLSKISTFQNIIKKTDDTMITNLPYFSSSL